MVLHAPTGVVSKRKRPRCRGLVSFIWRSLWDVRVPAARARVRFGAPPLARLAGKRSRVSSPRPLSGSNPTALGPPYEKGPVDGALSRSYGALCGIRTRDLSLRRRTLYPAELRELARDSIRHSAPSSKSAWFVWVGFSSVSTRFGWPGRSLTPYNEHSHAPARAPHRLEPS